MKERYNEDKRNTLFIHQNFNFILAFIYSYSSQNFAVCSYEKWWSIKKYNFYSNCESLQFTTLVKKNIHNQRNFPNNESLIYTVFTLCWLYWKNSQVCKTSTELHCTLILSRCLNTSDWPLHSWAQQSCL